ncbi:MAG: FtsX-like permease family protein [Actinobacteria bacterium]|nr:FtsX-like permease family protein [Actinomycetota bacterium]
MLPVILILLVVSIYDLIRRPTIRRLALRNLTRRRGEAALVILGSLLGTAIITAAFIVGDTLGASVRDHARTNLGPTDEVVRAIGLGKSGEIEAALKSAPLPNTDGLLAMAAGGGSVATLGADPRAEPFVQINEVDFGAARAFGDDEGITGMAKAGQTPSGNEAVLDQNLADEVEVKAGDRIKLFAYGQERELTVRQVLETKGLAGYGSSNLFVAPGTIASFVSAATLGDALGAAGNPPSSLVLVSNKGGVFDAADFSDSVTKELNKRITDLPGAEVVEAKRELLDDADANADQFKQIFGGVGAFSVIAGVLLLVNIFVMLADERKSELGMLRAIGLKRNQLVRAFGMEGAIYALVSSVFGVLAGIGVGRVVVIFAAGLFRGDGFRGGLDLIFSLNSSSLITSFMLGATISLVTVWGTSIRLGRLNVIRAIRDIAEAPPSGRSRIRAVVFAVIGVFIGLLLLQSGINQDNWFGALAGVPIAAFSSVTLLRPLVGRRFAVILGAGAALVWGIAVFTILPSALEKTEFNAFVVQGVILVGAAVAIVATNDDLAIKVVNSLGVSRRTLAARLGFAYPLARVFRTSMLLGMYSIVVFTLTFLSVFSNLFGAQAPRFARETAAGYQVLVDSNYSNPVPSNALKEADPNVEADAVLFQAYPKWTTQDEHEPTSWQVSGFDEALLARGTPVLQDIDPKYASSRAAWEAVLHDPSLVILPDFFLQGGGPPSTTIHAGDTIRAYDTVSGKTADLKVAAKVESDFVFNGPMVSQAFHRSFFSTSTPSRHYVSFKPGADARLAAARFEGKLVNYGVQADTFEDKISEALEQQEGFLGLMRGYLALGLIIGIAGLGVVMVRAVRERRRQIGMLRAMGFPSRVVRQAFLIEAAFIAIQGIVLGTVLALVTSYNLLTHSSTFGGQSINFEIPWVPIIVVLAVALVASLAASAFPAGQASRIKPAVALRIAD